MTFYPFAAAADTEPPWLPDDAGIGWLAWTYDPVACSVGSAPTNNTITLARINIRQPITVTNVIWAITAIGGGLTSGQNFIGLYNSAGTLIGRSADQTTAWGTAGFQIAALAGGPFSVPAGFYWAAVLPNETAGTVPSFVRSANTTITISNLGMGAAFSRTATAGTGTSLPDSITPSSLTPIVAQFWAAVS